MEFRDAIKHLRTELGLSQIELATALNVTPLTIGRWEKGKNYPNRAMSRIILDFAKEKRVSDDCMNILKDAISNASKVKLNLSGSNLFSVEHESLRQLIDEAGFPIYVCDMETNDILYLNQKAYKMIGCDDSSIGKPCYECIMHRDTPCPFCQKEELVYDHFTSREVLLPFEDTTYKILGKKVKWNGRDAHVRYIMETDSGSELKSIVANLNGGVSVVVFDNEDKVSLAYANEQYYAMFGYIKEQFFTELKNPHDILYPEDAKYVGEKIEKIKKEKLSSTFHYRIIKRNGSIAHISCSSSVSAVPGLGSKVLISVLTDITELVDSEQQTLVLGQRFNVLMKNISNAVTAITLNENGTVNIVFSNELYYDILGYTQEEYLREVHSPFELIYLDDLNTVHNAVKDLVQVGDTKILQYRIVCRNGKIKWIRAKITIVTFPDVNKPVQLAVYSDITDFMETNSQLTYERDCLNKTSKDKINGYNDIDEIEEFVNSDPLTGALNQSSFFKKVDFLIHKNPSAINALLFLDINGLKEINNT